MVCRRFANRCNELVHFQIFAETFQALWKTYGEPERKADLSSDLCGKIKSPIFFSQRANFETAPAFENELVHLQWRAYRARKKSGPYGQESEMVTIFGNLRQNENSNFHGNLYWHHYESDRMNYFD
jgi:hypothetical protein